MIGTTPATSVTGGGTVIDPYVLPVAADGTLGGIQLGYTTDAAARKYAVQLDNEKAYVNVPWTDHTYTLAGLVGGSVIGGSTQPIYWNGSSFVNTSYTLAKSVPSDAVFTDTDTWRPLGTGATDAAAGNHLHDDRYLKLEGGSMASGARINFSQGDGYLGNAGNEGWLMVQDICSQSGRGETYWAIRTNGQAVFTKMTSKTSSKALSDARHKDVKREVNMTVEQIAAMPAVIFEWLDKDLKDIDPGEHVGTLAQEWQKIMPQVVSEQQDGTLTMGYGEAALVSVITLARRVLKLERRVSKLEKEITKLKEQKNVTE